MTERPLRLVIADDHPVFREGLRTLLRSLEGAEIIAEARNGEEAVAHAQALRPDIVVMDLQMPGLSGIDATRAISASTPDVAVLVLTMFEDDDSVFAAIRAGARGYLLKGAGQEEIVRAIEAVASGEAIFGPAIAQRVMAWFAAGSNRADHPFPELTEREREVLELIAQGLPNAEIGTRLGVSPKTVRNHVSNVFNKMQVADRGQAIVRAREAGIGVQGQAS